MTIATQQLHTVASAPLRLLLLAVLCVLAACSRNDCGTALPPRYVQGEAALQQGRTDEARQLAREGQAEAADSDAYYRYEVLLAKCHFAAMQKDSLLLSNRRLADYLARQSQPTLQQQQLGVELEMQRGVCFSKMVGRMDSALLHFDRALQLASQLPCQTSNRLQLLINMADAYKQAGQYDQSVGHYRQAMELADSLGPTPATLISVSMGIASAYAAMGSFEQSSTWWSRAEELRPQMSAADVFIYLNNRGNDYFLQGQYRQSLQCFIELDSLLATQPDMVWERMFERCNLSDLYIRTGQPQRALPLLELTEQFFRQQQQPIPLYYLTTQRMELALMDNQPVEALRLDSLHPTPSWMIPEQLVLRQQVLISLYEQTGQWRQYAQAQQQLDRLRDSIASDNMKMRISEALMSYEHQKQLFMKQQQIEEKDLSMKLSLTMLLALALAVGLLVVLLAQKQRERKLREMALRNRIASLRMETVRNRITPHFISNALTAEMLAQMDGKPVNLDSLVQLLHRGIEFTGCEQTTLSEELAFISFYCDVESRSIGPDFAYELQVAPDVDAAKVVLPSMSVQILAENAIKHGLKPMRPQQGQQRKLWVKATRQDGGTLVEVVDNGAGLTEGQQPGEGTGLRVLRQTLQLLNEQNRQQMVFTLENNHSRQLSTGCRAALFLPDHFKYTLNNDCDGK